MLTFPPQRWQGDLRNDEYSTIAGIDVGASVENPDRTRQEFGAEADINTIMHRFGVTGAMPPQRQPVFTEVDYDLDLQTAMHAHAESLRAWLTIPEEIRRTYPTWPQLLAALNSGEIKLKKRDADAARSAATSTTESSVPSAGAPSGEAPPPNAETTGSKKGSK